MEYLTIEEAGKVLKVSRQTIYRYIKEGLLTRYRLKKKPVLDEEEVLKLNEPIKDEKLI